MVLSKPESGSSLSQMSSLATLPPLQQRSVRTLDAIVEATEKLLEQREFAAIGVADIIEEAGVSTGSFYARLGSKDALLPLLYHRYHQFVSDRAVKLVDEVKLAPDLQTACYLVVEPFIWMSTVRANLMRAVTLLARTDPNAIAHLADERTATIREIEAALLGFADEIARTPADRAVRMALFMAATMFREALLFPNAPFARATASGLPELRREVVSMMVGYLKWESGK